MRVTLNEDSQSRWNAEGAEHLRYEYDLQPDDVVFDIGSYRGEWAAEIYNRYLCRIIGIEPGPYNAFPNFHRFINKAASDHDGVMNFGGAYYYSSAHEDPVESFSCFDLNPVLAEYSEIALAKLNCEGDEYVLLPHIISASLHLRVKNWQIQFHMIAGEPWKEWYDAIVHELLKSHDRTFDYRQCWEGFTRL